MLCEVLGHWQDKTFFFGGGGGVGGGRGRGCRGKETIHIIQKNRYTLMGVMRRSCTIRFASAHPCLLHDIKMNYDSSCLVSTKSNSNLLDTISFPNDRKGDSFNMNTTDSNVFAILRISVSCTVDING